MEMPLLHSPVLETILRLILAAALGSILGWEREALRKPAGLRTYTMVSLGSAAFTLSVILLMQELAKAQKPGMHMFALDPARVIQGVLGGIGFLGAGVILRSNGHVKGVATAAGIWVTGAIGVACGCGQYSLALVVAILAFVVLTVFRMIEVRALDEEEKTAEREKERGEKGS